MKVVHTADIHLSSKHPERLEALEQIIDVCKEEDADILLITGDLFDQNINIEDLKTDLRPLFSDNGFETLVIPGNHDKSAFRQEDYFGEDITVLQEKPYSQEVFDELNIVALPYTDKEFSELVDTLSDATMENKKNILMIHCTLAGTSGSFGEESEYLPVRPSELVKTGFDYVLAGHIHSSATRKTFGDTKFAYSGSPVSISSSETGKREVWIIDTERGMETQELDTFYYLTENVEILPGEEKTSQEKIVSGFEGRDLEKASIIVKLNGFTEESVSDVSDDLLAQLEDLNPQEIELDVSGLESAASVVGSEIYIDFKERLDEKEFENPALVEKKFLRGLSRYER